VEPDGDMDVSIVVRTWNEREALRRLLGALERQRYDGGRIDLIVVDNESTDGTRELARARGARLLTIGEFTHPRSMNLGVEAARGEVVVLTVGHADPVGPDWLRRGVRHFRRAEVAGVHGPVIFDPACATLAERTCYGLFYLYLRLRGVHDVRQLRPGTLGATNAAIRKSLWQVRSFDEAYEAGGEDFDWARWALGQGWRIVCDPGFTVRHSHGVGWRQMRRQIGFWVSLSRPQPFRRDALLAFRPDLAARAPLRAEPTGPAVPHPPIAADPAHFWNERDQRGAGSPR
jgi:glycosyltransferase involved in cell wall biosynthesis